MFDIDGSDCDENVEIDRFEIMYFKAITTAQTRLTSMSKPEIQQNLTILTLTLKILLPVIKLPSFSSALSEWTSRYCYEV